MSKKQILGIDVGTRTIGMALVETDKKVRRILNTALLPVPLGCVENGQIKDVEIVSSLIKKTILENKIKVKSLAFSVHGQQVGIRKFVLPNLKKKEIYEAIIFDLSKTFSKITDTHAISYRIYFKSKESIEGIVAFCPKKIIESYLYLSEQIDIPLKYIDVNANSIAKTYNIFVNNAEQNGDVLIVDIGASFSQVNIIQGGKLVLSRNVFCGGSSVDKAVSADLNISVEQAEQDKLNKFIDYTLKGFDGDEYIRRGYEPIMKEIDQTIEYYRKYYEKKEYNIDKIFLVGGGSLLFGIESFFSKVFNIPTLTMKATDNNSKYIKTFSRLMPAIGTALREE